MLIRENPLFSLILGFLIIGFLLQAGWAQEATPSQKQQKEPLSKWSKQWLEEVVPYIITPAEKELFLSLPNERERGKFIDSFWKKRDPNPESPENEFKLEYYKRIALANKFFDTSGIEGWRTDRGKVYILLGPPNEIQRDMQPSGSYQSAFHGPKERWNYWGLRNPRLPYNLELVFIDKLGRGNYVLETSARLGEMGSESFDLDSMHSLFNQMEIMAEAMRNPFEKIDELKGIITTQVSYDRIPIDTQVFFLKGAEGQTYIPLAIEVPYSALRPKILNDERHYSLTMMINVSDTLGQVIYEWSRDIGLKHPIHIMPALKGVSHQVQTALSLQPDDYKVHILALDNHSGMVGTIHQDISVSSFDSTEMTITDIILSAEEPIALTASGREEQTKFTRVSQAFRPGGELNVYFEIYNLDLNPETGTSDFTIEYSFWQSGRMLTQIPKTTESGPEKDLRIRTSFRLKNFKPGDYTLQVKVLDKNSRKTALKKADFSVTY